MNDKPKQAILPFWPSPKSEVSEEYRRKQMDLERKRKNLRKGLGLLPEVNTQKQVGKIVRNLKDYYQPFMRNLSPCPDVRQIESLDGEGWRFMYERGMISREDWATGRGPDEMPWPYSEGEQDVSGWCTSDFDDSSWLEVTVPEYRGPRDRWMGWYRKRFTVPIEWDDGRRVVLHFSGVDWKSEIYLHGQLLGKHTGSNEPFECDITGQVRFGKENLLAVRVTNGNTMDISVCEEGLEPTQQYGPWYLPMWRGFHGSRGNGAGIWQEVWVSHTDDVWISDIYARPRIEESFVTLTASVQNKMSETGKRKVKIEIIPRNFEGERIEVSEAKIMQPGENVLTFQFNLSHPRLWTSDTPYLYNARVTLEAEGISSDVMQVSFGMRSFRMETEGKNRPKGTLYLNGSEIFLRGGYSPRIPGFVITKQSDEIINDLLMLKVANCNLIRMHGFQYQPVLYDYCDMLGMMVQQDHGLAGSKMEKEVPDYVYEQSAVMARHTRNHPSVVMVELANEMPLTRSYIAKSFEIIRCIDPDRVIKPMDSPPTVLHAEGLPDEHFYTGWYVGDFRAYGELGERYRGRIFPQGWRGGIGEYGVEGLDSWETMEACYQKDWYPENEDDPWDLSNLPCIDRRLTPVHVFPQEDCRAWIQKSQEYQALMIRLLTELWRRRASEIISTCHYYTIDWLPDGWLKALVGYDGRPKPAFYALRQCFQPLFVHLEGIQSRWFGGDTTDFNIWVCNDLPCHFRNYRVQWLICDPEWRIVCQNEKELSIEPSGAEMVEPLFWSIPKDTERGEWHVLLICRDEKGKVVCEYQKDFLVVSRKDYRISAKIRERRIGVHDPSGLLKPFLHGERISYREVWLDSLKDLDLLIVGKDGKIGEHGQDLIRFAQAGGRVLLLETCQGAVPVRKGCNEMVFVDRRHPIFLGLVQEDFHFWKKRGVVKEDLRLISRKGIGEQSERTLAISDKKSVVEELAIGKGRVVISQLDCLDRYPYHPIARLVVNRMVEYLGLTDAFQDQKVDGSEGLAAYLST